MTVETATHVFVSYVRENSAQIDELCGMFDVAGIPYWKDRDEISPGEDWERAIARAIRDGSLIFLACFSSESNSRRKNGMNRELTIACDEARSMQPGAPWLFPVRLDDCEISDDWELRPNYPINKLQRADLFGETKARDAVRLIEKLRSVLGVSEQESKDPEAIVREASQQSKPMVLRQQTEDLLLDPSNRIKLEKIVSGEIQSVITDLRLPRVLSFTEDEREGDLDSALARRAADHWQRIRPFCFSLQAAAMYGDSSNLAPWVHAITNLARATVARVDGNENLTYLRHLPLTAALMTAALASSSRGNWEAFRLLVTDQSTTSLRYDSQQVPLLLATGSFVPFRHTDIAPSILKESAIQNIGIEEAATSFYERRVTVHTPYADWLHQELRPVFDTQLPDDEEYDRQFDRAEVALGLVSLDLSKEQERVQDGLANYRGPTWSGRSAWRSMNMYPNAVDGMASEFQATQNDWPPLLAGLFGGDVDRANGVLTEYAAWFKESSRDMWR